LHTQALPSLVHWHEIGTFIHKCRINKIYALAGKLCLYPQM